ncbi:MAG: DUF1028 domain-containing protein [Flavobacteriales bacterium]|nr:DUF1028 domain-containing protein [Flavobacteriales bacterium]
MKYFYLILVAGIISSSCRSQDTFSIVALDSVTGEVGSAGASCVDLFQTTLTSDHFIGVLFPGLGAINTQAWYLPANQDNATNRMNLGDTPSEIIQWLVANDVSAQPELRQYGIVALVNGSPETAGHTGTSTDDYKNHITGPNYAIQGNILLGQQVLDSIESRFLIEEGDLACKLMAALQGANMVGADSRCATNGTSSLFSYVKVAQPMDAFAFPSFVVSVRTSNGAGIEPIDTLQTKFDLVHSCAGPGTGIEEDNRFDTAFILYPNPSADKLTIEYKANSDSQVQLEMRSIDGKLAIESTFYGVKTIDVSAIARGVYIVSVINETGTYNRTFVKK